MAFLTYAVLLVRLGSDIFLLVFLFRILICSRSLYDSDRFTDPGADLALDRSLLTSFSASCAQSVVFTSCDCELSSPYILNEVLALEFNETLVISVLRSDGCLVIVGELK